jgi:hypothetical protein
VVWAHEYGHDITVYHRGISKGLLRRHRDCVRQSDPDVWLSYSHTISAAKVISITGNISVALFADDLCVAFNLSGNKLLWILQD